MSSGRATHLRNDAPWHSSVDHPFGCCIYGAGHSTGDLTDEDVVPLRLGGNIVLRKASCPECARITSKFERICLQRNWGLHRLHAPLRTRRRRRRGSDKPPIPEVIISDAPPVLGPDVTVGNGLIMELRDGKPDLEPAQRKNVVPLGQHPHILMMPIFSGLPSLLTGSKDPLGLSYKVFYDRDAVAKCSTQHGRYVAVDMRFDVSAFRRLLAKIAHGMMFATFEMVGIRPLLLDIILQGDQEESWRYIGQGQLDQQTPQGANQFLTVSWTPVEGRTLIVVTIQLFAHYSGMPTYFVVAGETDTVPTYRSDARLDHLSKPPSAMVGRPPDAPLARTYPENQS